MKKTLLIATVLFVAVSFSSCDKDDKGDGALTQMRYVKQIIGIEKKAKAEFEYDSQNRIIKYSGSHYDDQSKTEYSYVWEFTYEGNIVKAKEVKASTIDDIIIFELNRTGSTIKRAATIQGGSTSTTEYTYDNNGGLIQEKDTDGDITTYNWMDGNRYPNYRQVIYSSLKAPKCNIDFSTDGFPIGRYSPLYLFQGRQSTNLLEELFYYEDMFDRYSYEFDNKGYISQITVYSTEYNIGKPFRYRISYY